MLTITLVISCLYAFLLAPASGFVAKLSEGVDKPVKDIIESTENVVEPADNRSYVAAVAEEQAIGSNFVNSKQFFLVTTEKVNWYRAAHICKFNGMELASINSMQENDIIAMLIKMSGCGGESDYFWTSGNDLGAFREWYWLADGRPMGFSNWGIGEPNNLGENERCVHLRWQEMIGQMAWAWNDEECTREFFFVCEIKYN